jgi:hypothetical protein
MHFMKHDEGVNARSHAVDQEAWVMLLNYPLDAKNNAPVAKAVAGFGLLCYWHDTNYMARIVVRVILKEDAQIPHDVTMEVGMPPTMRLKDRLGNQRGGSEWEPIKILLKG